MYQMIIKFWEINFGLFWTQIKKINNTNINQIINNNYYNTYKNLKIFKPLILILESTPGMMVTKKKYR